MAEQNVLKENIVEAAYHLKVMLKGRTPKIGIILGSGLSTLVDEMQDTVAVNFADVPHMKHALPLNGEERFVCGTLEGQCVLVMQKRLHGYEGNTSQEVAFPVWIMHDVGVETLITTNAAGAINESYRPGDFCLIADHINFMGRNPLVGPDPNGIAERFVPMHEAYDPKLRALARAVAEREGVPVQEGVYLGLLGPSLETPAEIRAFRVWGADTVAMSVIEEVIAARHVGMRVLGISMCSNMACGVGDAAPNIDEVVEVAEQAQPNFRRLIAGVLREL